MNQSKEIVSHRWNHVDLSFSLLWVRTARFLTFFFSEIVVKARGLASIHTRCEFWSVSLIFKTIFVLGLGFGIESVRTRCGFTWFWILQWLFSKMRWSLSVTCVLDWRLEPFLLILGSESFLVSLFHSFLSSSDPDPVKSFTASSLFFSDPQPVITLAARYSGGVLALDCRLSNSMMMIHMNLWESLEIALNSFAFRHCLLRWISFSDEFNEFVCNCAELVLELMLGFMNVLELFCDFVILICNCQERENWFCLCWCGAWIVYLILTCTVVAFHRLPHVPLSQWTCDMWTFLLAWHPLDRTVKKKTKMQFWELWDLKCNFWKIGQFFLKNWKEELPKTGIGTLCNKI